MASKHLGPQRCRRVQARHLQLSHRRRSHRENGCTKKGPRPTNRLGTPRPRRCAPLTTIPPRRRPHGPSAALCRRISAQTERPSAPPNKHCCRHPASPKSPRREEKQTRCWLSSSRSAHLLLLSSNNSSFPYQRNTKLDPDVARSAPSPLNPTLTERGATPGPRLRSGRAPAASPPPPAESAHAREAERNLSPRPNGRHRQRVEQARRRPPRQPHNPKPPQPAPAGPALP